MKLYTVIVVENVLLFLFTIYTMLEERSPAAPEMNINLDHRLYRLRSFYRSFFSFTAN